MGNYEPNWKKMNIGILLAGGIGKRLESSAPKQLMVFKSKTILEHTVTVFDKCDSIDKIILVVNEQIKEKAEEICNRLNKSTDIILGGNTRQESSFAALDFLRKDNPKIVVIHDIVRPFITHDIIDETIKEAKIHGAVDVVVEAADTIVIAKDGFISEIPDRKFYYFGQTPQTFQYDLIYNAHKKANEDEYHNATDDAQLFLRLGHKVKIVNGTEINIKLTSKEQIPIFEAIIKKCKNL